MEIHELKTEIKYFAETKYGNKPFEVRKNDRGFHEGDVVILKEWDGKEYTGREIRGIVRYILDDNFEGLKEEYVVMYLTNLQEKYHGMWRTIGYYRE